MYYTPAGTEWMVRKTRKFLDGLGNLMVAWWPDQLYEDEGSSPPKNSNYHPILPRNVAYVS